MRSNAEQCGAGGRKAFLWILSVLDKTQVALDSWRCTGAFSFDLCTVRPTFALQFLLIGVQIKEGVRLAGKSWSDCGTQV